MNNEQSSQTTSETSSSTSYPIGIHKYMVAVDGSNQSGKAFKWALEQVMRHQDLSKVHVTIIDFLPAADFDIETSKEYQSAKKLIEESLAEYSKILNDFNIPNEIKIVEGSLDAREGLCNQAKENNIDTLIMGNTGKSALKRMVLGSTSEYCVRNAECVVVVVK